MTRERVAVVSPREERRSSAHAWVPLLHGRAEVSLCAHPEEAPPDADLVVLDEDCDDLDGWLARVGERDHAPDSIVVFGTSGESTRGAIPWGLEGEQVLATISDLLERRRLLEDSDEVLASLRGSNSRLDEHRRRFARLVIEQAEGLRGANVSLSREVDRLNRLQSVARFFAAPGPDASFAERLAEVTGRALGAVGAAVVRRVSGQWTPEGRWRISWRNTLRIIPDPPADEAPCPDRPATRKGHHGHWIPVGDSAGIVALFRSGAGESAVEPALVAELRALLTDAFDTREEARVGLQRLSLTDRVVRDLRGGLLKVDAGGRVALANPALADILGISPDALENRPVGEVFSRDPHVLELLGSSGGDEIETWLTESSGRRVAVTVRVSRLEGAAEGPGGVLMLVSDLSRRKEVEAEIRRADRLAALGRLSAGVAHEIRNPLTGIRTTAELLRGRVEDDEDLKRFAEVILEESTRLDRIVGSLLQFAKPAAPRREPLELGPLLERVTRLAARQAAERGVRMRVSVPSDAPRPLADRDQILQVVLNLALNAVDASPEGGEVLLGIETGGASEVILRVEDEGDGVPPAIGERVFDPFFTTKSGGTGLGLSISQNIVAQHGGSLRFARDGRGPHRALVRLPLGATTEPEGGRRWRAS